MSNRLQTFIDISDTEWKLIQFRKEKGKVALRRCDVISVNRYRFSPSDLRMLEGVDRPLIIGEFHFGALDRGMFHTGLQATRDPALKQCALLVG